MMRYIFSLFLFLTVLLTVSQSQTLSCLDNYNSFSAINPEILNSETVFSAQPALLWYESDQCFLLGSSNGLWLYDIESMDRPIQLVSISAKAVEDITVNPVTSLIAFSILQESRVYLMSSDGLIGTLEVSGNIITDIAFSPNGQVLAIASSTMIENEGIISFTGGEIEIWDMEQNLIQIIPVGDFVTDVFFSPDSRNLLSDTIKQDYNGDDIEYWDIRTASRLWSTSDFIPDNLTESDPFAISMVILGDNKIFLGGTYGDWGDYYLGTAVNIWDIEAMEREGQIFISRRGTANSQNLSAFSLNCDGTELVTAQGRGMLRFWELENLSQTSELNLENAYIYSLLYSPNCDYLAILEEYEIMILNLERMEPEVFIDSTRYNPPRQ